MLLLVEGTGGGYGDPALLIPCALCVDDDFLRWAASDGRRGDDSDDSCDIVAYQWLSLW